MALCGVGRSLRVGGPVRQGSSSCNASQQIYSHPTSVPGRMLCRSSSMMATSVHYESGSAAATPPPTLSESSAAGHPLLSHHLLMKNEHLPHHHHHHHHRLYQPYNHLPTEVYEMGGYPLASTSGSAAASAAAGGESRCSSVSSSGGGDPHQLTLKSEGSSVDNNMELLDSGNVSFP